MFAMLFSLVVDVNLFAKSPKRCVSTTAVKRALTCDKKKNLFHQFTLAW